MHASAEKIRKPKARPVPRMKRAAPKKLPPPADGRLRRRHRMRDHERIIPGLSGFRTWRAPEGHFVENPDIALTGTVRETRQWWACTKAKRLAGERVDPNYRRLRREFYFLKGRTRQFKKFARTHPGEVVREDKYHIVYRVFR